MLLVAAHDAGPAQYHSQLTAPSCTHQNKNKCSSNTHNVSVH
jgi:hypothetical protein